MMQITFTADTLTDLVAQIRAFIGDAPATPTSAPATAPTGRQVPDWAPAGSRWLATPGAPALIGPDGKPIPIDWSGGIPRLGTATVNRDPAAEAAGEALLQAQGGTP